MAFLQEAHLPPPETLKLKMLGCITFREYRHVRAFIFAINQINMNPDILPNITLGYHLYDSCGNENKAIEDVFRILSGYKEFIPNYRCMKHGKVGGFIGDLNSHTTIPMAQMLNVYGYSQISYGARGPALSDRRIYPQFFRTSYNDQMQFVAIVKLLRLFNWNWVGIISSDDESGEREIQQLSRQLTTHGICIEFSLKLFFTNIFRIMSLIVNIQKSTAEIIILCGTYSVSITLLIHRMAQFTVNKTFILPATWSAVREITVPSYMGVPVNCCFVFSLPVYNIPEVESFLDKFNQPNYSNDPLLEDLWITQRRCMSKNELKNSLFSIMRKINLKNCTGVNLSPYYNFPEDPLPYRVYIAVSTMAQALHDMYLFFNTNVTKHNFKVNENQLHTYIQKVYYEDEYGNEIMYNEKGELSSTLELVNRITYDKTKQNSILDINIGKFDESIPGDKQLYIEPWKIHWRNERYFGAPWLPTYSGDIHSTETDEFKEFKETLQSLFRLYSLNEQQKLEILLGQLKETALREAISWPQSQKRTANDILERLLKIFASRTLLELMLHFSAKKQQLNGTLQEFAIGLKEAMQYLKAFKPGEIIQEDEMLVSGFVEGIYGEQMKSHFKSAEALQVTISKTTYTVMVKKCHKKLEMPHGQCSEKCSDGFRKAPKEGYHACCYNCVPCSEGEISNKSDNENCVKCSDTEWPNDAKNSCISKSQEFLSYEVDYMTLFFSGIAVLFFAIIVFIFAIFVYFRSSQIVRANNQNLSFILLISIKLCLLCVFLFLGRPVDITCMLRQICFGVIFTITVSSVLAKTIMVCIAFKATRPGSYWRKWMGAKLPNSLVLFCSSVQVLNGVIWLSVSPPFQEFNMDTYPGTIIIQCNEGSVLAFYFMLGYMGLLAAVSFALAFMVRTLPDIYNEAKYITFSMLVFCSVWVCAIPAYLSSKGKHMVIVEVFAILASCIGILGCMFFPKCYNILRMPHVKRKELLCRGKNIFTHNNK
ncbi:vomeronasal type-2 receptor 26-like [Pseudophryne corroboree]|uniref:vomeronasal type-2 receptor 26-like n=1 Tax=Pseudophryne corroboree TaxID=495146 RepID=UPI0030812325